MRFACARRQLFLHYTAEKGNHVHVDAPIKQYERVLKASSLSTVVQPSSKRSCCAFCFAETDGKWKQRCVTCNYVYYCSEACQAEDAEEHGRVCGAIARMFTKEAYDALSGSAAMFLLVLHVLHRVDDWPAMFRLDRTKTKDNPPATTSDAFALLQSCIENVDDDDMAVYRADAAVYQYVSPVARKLTIAQIVELQSRVACNCFRVENEALDMIGLGVFPGASYFNHSCHFNACYIVEGRTITFHATEDIAAGDEISISYIRLVGGRDKRRTKLKTNYYFDCDCRACRVEPRFPELRHLRCANAQCELHSPPAMPVPGSNDDVAELAVRLAGSRLADRSFLERKTDASLMDIVTDDAGVQTVVCPQCSTRTPAELVLSQLDEITVATRALNEEFGEIDWYGEELEEDEDEEEEDGDDEAKPSAEERAEAIWRAQIPTMIARIENEIDPLVAKCGLLPTNPVAYRVAKVYRKLAEALDELSLQSLRGRRDTYAFIRYDLPDLDFEVALEANYLAETLLAVVDDEANGLTAAERVSFAKQAVQAYSTAADVFRVTYGTGHSINAKCDAALATACAALARQTE